MKNVKQNQSGFGHVELLIVLVLVGAIGFAAWRVVSNDDGSSDPLASISTQEALPEGLKTLKSLDEIGQVAGVSTQTPMVSFVLEDKDGVFVYDIVLSNGKKVSINAVTGEVLSEETTDVSDDDKLPEGFEITITPAQAYDIASSKSDSPVKSIELEVEDDKVTYKVELEDGSKVEIDAGTGNIVKSEIKDEDEDKKDDDSDDEDESEDEYEDESDDDDEDEEDESDEEDEDESDEEEKDS